MSRYWRCSHCGAILKKKHPPETIEKIKAAGKKITGTSTCGKCSTTFQQAEVYDGLYDLDSSELAEIARKKKAEKGATAKRQAADPAAEESRGEVAQAPSTAAAEPASASQSAGDTPPKAEPEEPLAPAPRKPAGEAEPIAPSKPQTPPPSPGNAQTFEPPEVAASAPQVAPDSEPELDPLDDDDDVTGYAPDDAFQDSGVDTGMFEPGRETAYATPSPAATTGGADAGALPELEPSESVGDIEKVGISSVPDEAGQTSFREFRPALPTGAICCDVCAAHMEQRGGYLLSKEEVLASPDYLDLVLERWQVNGYLPRGEKVEAWHEAAKQDIDTQAGTEPWLVCDECIILFPAVREEALETAAQRAHQWWPASNMRPTTRFTGRGHGTESAAAPEVDDVDDEGFELGDPLEDEEALVSANTDEDDADEALQTLAAPPGEIAVSHMDDEPDPWADEDDIDEGLLLDDDEDEGEEAVQTMLAEPESIAVTRYDEDDDLDLDLDDDDDPFTLVDPLDDDEDL